jgi:hypothetical protein
MVSKNRLAWVPCGEGKTKANWIFGQFRGSGILFLQCGVFLDRGALPWQKPALLLFQWNEKRHVSDSGFWIRRRQWRGRRQGVRGQRVPRGSEMRRVRICAEKLGSGNRVQRVCIQDLTKVRITRRRFADKKSTPRMGFETAAKMNVQRKVLMPKFSVFRTEPHDGIDLPSAPESGGPEEGSVEV